jgi:hypothetical protein
MVVCALKGQLIIAQGNALGKITLAVTGALKGQLSPFAHI